MNKNRPSPARPPKAARPLRLFRRNQKGKAIVQALKESTVAVQVEIPADTKPGDHFLVNHNGRILKVMCPPNGKPGRSMMINVPVQKPGENTNAHDYNRSSNLSGNSHNQQQNSMTTSDNIHSSLHSNNSSLHSSNTSSHQHSVSINNSMHSVGHSTTTLQHSNTGHPRRPSEDQPPQQPPTTHHSAPSSSFTSQHQHQQSWETFEVRVPQGGRAGEAFAVVAANVRWQVVCPQNAGPGDNIRFKIPSALVQSGPQKPSLRRQTSTIAAQRLSFDKDGWARTVRATDLKLQWVRMNKAGGIDMSTMRRGGAGTGTFDLEKSAYVRRLQLVDLPTGQEQQHVNMRQGTLSLIPAWQAVVDATVRDDTTGKIIIDYPEIATAQSLNFPEKKAWFHEKCEQVTVDWEDGHLQVTVRREHLLEDSVNALMSLNNPRELRQKWTFCFMGEEGLDAGGLTREWFQLVGEAIFDVNMGFWCTNPNNPMLLDIDPTSEIFQSENYLRFYRFVGRFLGRAVFGGQLVTAGRLVPYIYKHLLGFPITFKDLRSIDEDYYNNLQQIKEMVDSDMDVETMLCLDFTTTVEMFGEKQEVPLVEGGADMPVTNDNYKDYLEACLMNKVMKRTEPHLTELLLGFFDVVPEALLAIFDHQELELLMCGLFSIDVEDWRTNTDYMGIYEMVGEDYCVCEWFWEVVESFDEEMKARLLQFATGSSGVPASGFGGLMGSDGKLQKFTINGVDVGTCLYPRAHTCFNRLDLPCYETKEELKKCLTLAVTMVATGFDIE